MDQDQFQKALSGAQIITPAKFQVSSNRPEEVAPAGYTRRRDGIFKVNLKGELTWISDSFDVYATIRGANGRSWGKLIVWTDADGRTHDIPFYYSELAGDGTELRSRLLDHGIRISTDSGPRSALNAYLLELDPKLSAHVVERPGWHQIGDQNIFVMADATVIGADDSIRVILKERRGTSPMLAGTFESWEADVAKNCANNQLLILGISAALVAPLLEPLGERSVGFHLRGASSTGKTTILRAAQSVWSSPLDLPSWRATANGLEGIAAESCDALLALDELSEIDAKQADQVSYMLGNGRGKTRADRSGHARPTLAWRILFLSTGEIGIAQKIAEDGRGKARAGQSVRMIDVSADGKAGMGAFQDLHGADSAAAFSNQLSKAASQNYGHLAIKWIEVLCTRREEALARVRETVERFEVAHLSEMSDGQVVRMARSFGLIAAAGEAAIHFGLLPWTAGHAFQGVSALFKAYIEERGFDVSAEEIDAIRRIRSFIEKHGSSRFSIEGEADTRIVDRAGWRRTQVDDQAWFFFVSTWKEIIHDLDVRQINRLLITRGIIEPGSQGRSSQSVNLSGMGRVRAYKVLPAIFEIDI